MSSNIRELVDFVKSMDDFVKGISDCEAAGCTINQETINDIAEIRPDILEYIESIRNFITSQKVIIEVPKPAVIEPVVEVKKEKTKYRRLKHDDIEVIGEFIRDNCNNMTIDKTKTKVHKRFSSLDVADETLDTVVIKKTFVNITDKYFTIENKRIVAVGSASVEEPKVVVEKVEEKLITNKGFVRTYTASMPTKSFNSLLKILDQKHLFQLISENPELTKSQIVDIAKVELDRVNNGMSTESLAILYGILILDVMDKTGATKTVSVRKSVYKTYGIHVDNTLINDIKNRRVLTPQILDKF
jgi:hypothetical protein